MEQLDPRLCPELGAKEVWRVGPHRHLHPRDGLRGVPEVREVRGRDLQVALHRRAGGLGSDRVHEGGHPLAAPSLHVQEQVLAPRLHDRVVEPEVARRRRQRVTPQVLLGQRGQDADGDDVRVTGLVPGRAQVLAQRLLQRVEAIARERLRLDVELDVEARELALEEGVVDGLENRLVGHAGSQVLVDEVHLDLQPRHRLAGLEVLLPEHALQHVQALLDLFSITLTQLAGVQPGGDLLTHAD